MAVLAGGGGGMGGNTVDPLPIRQKRFLIYFLIREYSGHFIEVLL